MARNALEFYCNDCDGYFMVYLRVDGPDYRAEIKCPNCGRAHPRYVIGGEIIDSTMRPIRLTPKTQETIHTTIATYSKKPFTQKMQSAKRGWSGARDSAKLTNVMADRWLEKAAKERGDID